MKVYKPNSSNSTSITYMVSRTMATKLIPSSFLLGIWPPHEKRTRRFYIGGSNWVQLSHCTAVILKTSLHQNHLRSCKFFHYPNWFNWSGIKSEYLWFKNFLQWVSYTAKGENYCFVVELMEMTHSWIQRFSSVSCQMTVNSQLKVSIKDSKMSRKQQFRENTT